VTVPLAPRTARAIDLAVGERCEGPIFLAADGQRLDRHAAGRIARRIARKAGITKQVGPHTLRHAFITAALDAGVPLRLQEAASLADPRTTMRYDRARVSLDRHATYIVATILAGGPLTSRIPPTRESQNRSRLAMTTSGMTRVAHGTCDPERRIGRGDDLTVSSTIVVGHGAEKLGCLSSTMLTVSTHSTSRTIGMKNTPPTITITATT
jgi:hypothetical protein